MDGRWAVLSDVHGNYPALAAVLRDAEALAVEGCFFLGDAVGYGPEPQRCIERLTATVAPGAWVLGNHDAALLLLAHRGGGPAAGTDAAELTMQIGSREEPRCALEASWELLRLFPERLTHLAAQPLEARLNGSYLVHGGLRHGRPTTTGVCHPPDARDELAVLGARFGREVPCWLLVGHTHRPVAFRQGSGEGRYPEDVQLSAKREIDLDTVRWVLNPGSVGQPRDGDPRASYLLLDAGRRTARLRRVTYDVTITQRRMAELGLPANLITRLAAGR